MNITIRNLPAFESKCASLNRRAKRLGLPAVTFTVLRTQQETVEVFDISGAATQRIGTESVLTYTLELSGAEAPMRLNGWAFLARLTPHGAAGNLVAGLPGAALPAKYRACTIECEHCGTNRRRNDSFVLRHEDGEYRQVGRTCLRDFLGSDNGERVAKQFEFSTEVYLLFKDYADAEARTWGGGGEATFPLINAVAKGLAVHGGKYFSVARAEEAGTTPTAHAVRLGWGDIKETEAQRERAEEMIATVTEEMKPDGDYAHNVLLVARAGYVTRKSMGVGVSIIAAFNRLQGDKVRAAAAATSEHVGTVGERIKVEAVLERCFTYETQWGRTTKCILRTAAGALVVANNLPGEIGQTVRFVGTVKEHNEFRGAKQTVLARPAKAEVVLAA